MQRLLLVAVAVTVLSTPAYAQDGSAAEMAHEACKYVPNQTLQESERSLARCIILSNVLRGTHDAIPSAAATPNAAAREFMLFPSQFGAMRVVRKVLGDAEWPATAGQDAQGEWCMTDWRPVYEHVQIKMIVEVLGDSTFHRFRMFGYNAPIPMPANFEPHPMNIGDPGYSAFKAIEEEIEKAVHEMLTQDQ